MLLDRWEHVGAMIRRAAVSYHLSIRLWFCSLELEVRTEKMAVFGNISGSLCVLKLYVVLNEFGVPSSSTKNCRTQRRVRALFSVDLELRTGYIPSPTLSTCWRGENTLAKKQHILVEGLFLVSPKIMRWIRYSILSTAAELPTEFGVRVWRNKITA